MDNFVQSSVIDNSNKLVDQDDSHHPLQNIFKQYLGINYHDDPTETDYHNQSQLDSHQQQQDDHQQQQGGDQQQQSSDQQQQSSDQQQQSGDQQQQGDAKKQYKSQYHLINALYKHQLIELRQLKSQNEQLQLKIDQCTIENEKKMMEQEEELMGKLRQKEQEMQQMMVGGEGEINRIKQYYKKLLTEKDDQIKSKSEQQHQTMEQLQQSYKKSEQLVKMNDSQQNQINKLRKNMQRLSKILKYKQQVLEEQFNIKLYDQIRNYHRKQKSKNERSKSCPEVISEQIVIEKEINLCSSVLKRQESIDNYNLEKREVQKRRSVESSNYKNSSQQVNESMVSEKSLQTEGQETEQKQPQLQMRKSVSQKIISNQIYSCQSKYIKNIYQKQIYLQNEKEKIFDKVNGNYRFQEQMFGLIERLEKMVILTHELQSQLEKHLRIISFQVFQKSLKKLNKDTLKILNYFNMIEFGINGYIVDGNDGHVDYLMVLNDKLLEREWKFKARFSLMKKESRKFLFEVPKQLSKYFPVFPSSQIFNFSAHSDDFLQKRKQDLNKYFKVLFHEKSIQKYVNYNRLQEFIQQQIIEQLDAQNHFMVLENELQLNKYSRLCCKVKVNVKQQKMESMKQYFHELDLALQKNLDYNQSMIDKLSQEMEKAEVNDSLLLMYFEDKYHKNQMTKQA